MRVLILNYEFPPLGGGAANATYYLMCEFARYTSAKLQIDLVTSSISEFKIEQFSENITIHYLDIGKKGSLHFQTYSNLLNYSYKAYYYSKKLLNKQKFDSIHAFFGIPCGFIAMLLKLPYIVSLRGSDVPFYNHRFRIADKLLFQHLSRIIWRKAKFVVCNSLQLQELALKTYKKANFKIIYNGVNRNEFYYQASQRNEKLTLISTGRLIERKGFKYLFEALKSLNDVKLILVGEGDMKDELVELSQAYKLEVEFVGMIKHSEIATQLRRADVFVLPSLNEGMSNSVLEAMACGLPIITTNVGGSSELIKENGFITEKQSVEQLRKAICFYKENREIIERHSQASLTAAMNFEWNEIAYMYFELYTKKT